MSTFCRFDTPVLDVYRACLAFPQVEANILIETDTDVERFAISPCPDVPAFIRAEAAEGIDEQCCTCSERHSVCLLLCLFACVRARVSSHSLSFSV